MADNLARILDGKGSSGAEPVNIRAQMEIEQLERIVESVDPGELYSKLASSSQAAYNQLDALLQLARKYKEIIEGLRKEVRQKTYESLTDHLTKLANRRKAEMFAKELIAISETHNEPISVIFMDVDNFKRYNDSYGHKQGDVALQTFANVLQKFMKDADIAAKYGGEEFIAILPGAGAKAAEARAETIRNAIKKAVVPLNTRGILKSGHDGNYGHITVSAGVFTYHPDKHKLGSAGAEDKFGHLCGLADKALYKAKARGRDRVEVYDGTEDLPQKQSLYQKFKGAIRQYF
jgi:diguanylate cyclase (GGDEF)-like protein